MKRLTLALLIAMTAVACTTVESSTASNDSQQNCETMEATTGSRIARKRCVSKEQKQQEQRAAQDYMQRK